MIAAGGPRGKYDDRNFAPLHQERRLPALLSASVQSFPQMQRIDHSDQGQRHDKTLLPDIGCYTKFVYPNLNSCGRSPDLA